MVVLWLGKQMAFEGTLYITDKHTCFDVEEQGRKLPITLEHAAVRKVFVLVFDFLKGLPELHALVKVRIQRMWTILNIAIDTKRISVQTRLDSLFFFGC